MIYNDILETIGGTPVIRINRLAPDDIEMYVKVEAFNPLSSVKDRLAYAIIRDAEDKGALKAGQTVIEATSGNTGIALAMVCAARGYPFVSVMAESFSIERRKIMKALGAKVILTPAAERATGMVRLAEELAERHGWFLAQQFENPANPAYHRNTTGPEILKALNERLGAWGVGRHIYTGDVTIGLKGRIAFECPGIDGLLAAHQREITGIVAEPFFLLEGGVVLLIHDDQTDLTEGGEDARPGADGDGRVRIGDSKPLVISFAL